MKIDDYELGTPKSTKNIALIFPINFLFFFVFFFILFSISINFLLALPKLFISFTINFSLKN